MRDTALYIATKVCWDHDVYVVVKPISQHKYKLAISRNGREKPGEQVYGDHPVTKPIFIERNGKKYRQEVFVPSVHQKIVELYLDLYQKNFKGMMPKPIEPENNYQFNTQSA